MSKEHLLTTTQMALFVARGFLRFDGIVPGEINEAFLQAVEDEAITSNRPGSPLDDCYKDVPSVRALIDLPAVTGIINSLVGPGSLIDHHALHKCPPRQERSQYTHADSIIDLRTHFDIQLMYFPQNVTRDMGGTRFVPGTHFRRVNESSISRYQNILGQQHIVCEPGSLFVMHHGIWHGGGRNRTDQTRYMFKIRLNPTLRQRLLWNTDDLEEKSLDPTAIFDKDAYAHPDPVQTIFERREKWFGPDEGRLEIVNRIKLWRFLLGDDSFDSHYWLSRLENKPETAT